MAQRALQRSYRDRHLSVDANPSTPMIRWSPGRRSIAFESDRDGTFAVYVVAADGTGLKKLTPAGVEDSQPGWSPMALDSYSRRTRTDQAISG